MHTFMKNHFLPIITLLIISLNLYSEQLYIFIPSEHTSIEIEKKLKNNFPGITIRSFGSIIDFRKAVQSDSPAAVITKPQLLPFFERYSIKLQGRVNGNTREPFFILSVEQPISLNALKDKSIGILDFIGRKHITDFTSSLFGVQPKFKLKRVKKVADLLPLVSMNLVDGIVVSSTQAAYLKKRSNLTFYETKCKKEQSIAVLALSKDSNTIVESLKKLPPDLSHIIGVDGWN